MTAPTVVPLDAALEQAVQVLDAGGLVVLPTDTVYGLAARAADTDATPLIFERKGRGADVPLAVLCADADQAFALVSEVPPAARRLADAHWPGPLTMVLPRRPDLGWALGRPEHTIGVRCPDHDFVRALAARVGPLATTSANRHGSPTPLEASDAATSLLGDVELVVDGGRLVGTPSTVVDVTGPELVVLRQGPLQLDA